MSWPKYVPGYKVGNLTLIRKVGSVRTDRSLRQLWECRCDCGNICVKNANSFSGNKRLCCPACQDKNKSYIHAHDLSGRVFGHLTVIERAGPSKWRCRCDCGNVIVRSGRQLEALGVTSCGCARESEADIRRSQNGSNVTGYIATESGNTQVSFIRALKPRGKSGHIGVNKTSSDTWTATIMFGRKKHYLGTYKTIEEAIAAREEGEKKYFEPVISAYEPEVTSDLPAYAAEHGINLHTAQFQARTGKIPGAYKDRGIWKIKK